MRYDICSICKQPINNFDHSVVIGYGIPEVQYAFCETCGRPVVAFLNRHQLKSFTEAHKLSWQNQRN
ncbi:MAG TPA: hypothetical protein VFD58_07965 [Blastocatellia bacterium]|nr:hypothetical protein [Blastocatellia bacterium]